MSRTILLAAALLSAGCFGPEPEPDHVLTGTVTYGGERPLAGSVAFLGSRGQVATATLNDDGSFRIVNPPTGRVRVGVVNHPTGPVPMPSPGTNAKSDPARAFCIVPPRPQIRFPVRFAEASTSTLEVEIARGQSTLDIALERRDDDPPIVRKSDFHEPGIEIGDIAPEIGGTDLDDVPFKLSDYRGKVVALMFWGHWCKLCRDRYDHERRFVARMKGQPFVLLGVNSDLSRDTVRKENARHNIPWRTWWDGPIPGPVSQAWHVEGLPYVVLIDHTGRVRHRAMDAAELDRAADALVADVPR